jgi:hypothetical protein
MSLTRFFIPASFLLCAAFPAAAFWTDPAGLQYAGFRGIATVDLDGDGKQEAVVTGSSFGASGMETRDYLAVLDHSPERGYQVRHQRVLGRSERIEGKVLAYPQSEDGVGRVAVVVTGSEGRQLLTFAG